jgi:hypothetical protein
MADACVSLYHVTELAFCLDSTYQAVQALVLPLENKSLQVDSMR